MRAKHEVIDRTCARYRRARKSTKGKILDEFIQTTGYARKYAAWILSHWRQTVVERIRGKVISFKVGLRVARPRSGRPVVYDDGFRIVLADLWFLFDCLCGKRFVVMIRGLLDAVLATDELTCSDTVRALLMKVSPATVDRLLARERKKLSPHGTSITRPGGLLKGQVAIRTFTDWSDATPGFFEADLVAHDGGSAFGDFHCTLTMTDVATGWTETVAVLNKAQKHVFPGLQRIRDRLPFAILGLDTDNGSEFINGHLVRYCAQEHIPHSISKCNSLA